MSCVMCHVSCIKCCNEYCLKCNVICHVLCVTTYVMCHVVSCVMPGGMYDV